MLKNVTNAELDALDKQLFSFIDTLDYASRIQHGHCDAVRDPVWRARMCLAASRRLADIAAALLNLSELQQLRKAALND